MGLPSDSVFHGLNAAWLEDQLSLFWEDPEQVEPTLREFFVRSGLAAERPPAPSPEVAARSIFAGRALSPAELNLLTAQVRVVQLIEAYRSYGHLKARLDPLGLADRPPPRELSPAFWGLNAHSGKQRFSTAMLNGPQVMSLDELVTFLDETYARTIGAEFTHINDPAVQDWIASRCEETRNHCNIDAKTQRFVLEKLCAAEALEDFLHRKFRGSKRFSLQGAESLIPLLALLVEEAGSRGVREIVIGMPHRGRLNVMVNIMGMSPKQLFSTFEDRHGEQYLGRGDVKYHLGWFTEFVTRFGDDVALCLTHNPSHLEAINPVVLGRVRARQDRFSDAERLRGVPVLIHGDAAFAGQGLVAETLNLMGLGGYTVGGTIHIVVNNQIGFTTLPEESRSVPYCTDIAKMVEVPIFHVNGEDPEAVAQTVRLAVEFRQTFHRDVIIDMYCFRRFGHNEADEPTFTQPLQYKVIDSHPSVHAVYGEYLTKLGQLDSAGVERISQREHQQLDEALGALRSDASDELVEPRSVVWKNYVGGPDHAVNEVDTGVPLERLHAIMDTIQSPPEGFVLNPKIARIHRRHRAMRAGEALVDWAVGEQLAFGSLLLDGHPVRLSGQDSCRGTFSHRHAVLTNPETGEAWTPLNHIEDKQAFFEVINSPLSEAGVLGFEFGYAIDAPGSLVIWEAQFGDFANGAQVIIDQFLAASEDKWGVLSGVVLLLPHGYEGQGPEHSSARLERFLQLCAEDNLQVVNPTTPAQLFHLLRRQIVRTWRKPLIVMSPKSLLRHRKVGSELNEFVEGRFQRVIPDLEVASNETRRLVLCSGKVYYDLVERRDEQNERTIAIARVEQLYPFPDKALSDMMASMPHLEEVLWCQEEPKNMGAFTFVYPRLSELLPEGVHLRSAERAAGASPATGSYKAHQIEQAALLDAVFSIEGKRSR